MRSVSGVGRVAAVGAVIAAVALLAIVLFGDGDGGGYTVKAKFINAGQLVTGNPVQTGGSPIGSVKGIKITDDGQAEIEFKVEDDYAPLRRGTRAAIRQFSQSGIANRYIDLHFPGGRERGAARSPTAARSAPTRPRPRSTSTSSSTRSTPRPARRSRSSSAARPTSSGTQASRPTPASTT